MSSDRSYHHGNLREALLREGLTMLVGEQADELSLRALARRVGVSAPSVYRHFADKDALFTALAREGLAQMAAAQRAAASKERDAQAALAATGLAYVGFALGNPVLFRLIFASSAGTGEIGTAEAFQMLHENAAKLLPSDAGEQAIRERAIRAWTTAHGLAMLILDGQLPADPTMIAALFKPTA